MISPLDKIVEYGCRLSTAMRHFTGFSCVPWKGLQMGGGKDLKKIYFQLFLLHGERTGKIYEVCNSTLGKRQITASESGKTYTADGLDE